MAENFFKIRAYTNSKLFVPLLSSYHHHPHHLNHSSSQLSWVSDLFSLKSKQLDNFTRYNLKNLKTHFRTCEVRMRILQIKLSTQLFAFFDEPAPSSSRPRMCDHKNAWRFSKNRTQHSRFDAKINEAKKIYSRCGMKEEFQFFSKLLPFVLNF